MSGYTYLKEFYIHNNRDVPIITYSKLNGDRVEIMRIELMPDGTLNHASNVADDDGLPFGNGTWIEYQQPFSELADLNSPDWISPEEQVRVFEIGADEFYAVWNEANRRVEEKVKDRLADVLPNTKWEV